MSHDLAAPWKSRSTPALLTTPSSPLAPRRPTGLLSAAAVELIGDVRLGTPLARSRLNSRQGDFANSGHARPISRTFSRSTALSQASQGPLPSSPGSFSRFFDWGSAFTSAWQTLADETLNKPSSPYSSLQGSRPGTRQNVGPSLVAVRENCKKEIYSQQIQQVERTKILSGTGKQEVMTEIVKVQNPQDFLKNVSSFEQKIHECGRVIRMEHLGRDPKDIEADRRAAEKAAQSEWEEKQKKIARKKEQMARDPHRKIQLKIENRRKFEMDTVDQAGIPMQTIDIGGGKGREQVTLVDVRQLQSSSIGLGETGGVRAILDLQLHRDKVERMTTTTPMAPRLGLQRQFSSSMVSTSTYDERLEVVLDNKHANYVEDLGRKFDTMRQPKPTRLPHTHLGIDRLRKASCAIINVNRCIRHNIDVDKLDDLDVVPDKPEVVEPPVPEVPPEVKARAQRGWHQLRGVVNYLRFLYFRHRRELRSIECVKGVLLQLSEWARIRSAMTKMSNSIKRLQRTCRGFLGLRDKRIAIMTKDWQRVEDHYLTGFFKMYAIKAMEEHEHQKAEAMLSGMSDLTKKQSHAIYHTTQKPQGANTLMTRDQAESLIDNTFDWRCFRIPSSDRRAMLIRFYMINLQRHIRNELEFKRTVHHVIRWNREALSFLQNEFGAVQPPKSKNVLFNRSLLNTMPADYQAQSSTFWHLTDDVYLDMISLGATSLRACDPFQEHPINRGKILTEECYDKYCRVPKRLMKDVRTALQSEIKDGIKQEVPRKRRTVSVARVRISKLDEEQIARATNSPMSVQPVVDLDELWKRFEPRLMDISAEIEQSEQAESKLDGYGEPVMH